MQLIGISINHNTAPIEMRESLYLSEDEIRQFVPILKKTILSEGFILSTCNRTEIFGVPNNPDFSSEDLRLKLQEFKNVNNCTKNNFNHFFSCSAIRHIFKVAAGLDSLMIGDSQILSQIKASFILAQELEFNSTIMNRIFDATLKVGKHAISNTNIGEGAVTISYAAVQLIQKIYSNLKNKNILIIGAGETSELALTHIVDKGAEKITVTNRTFEKAKIISEKHKTKILKFHDFRNQLQLFDVIISATSSPEPIVTFADMKKAISKRKGAPIVVLDIAIPRDFDETVNNIDNVFYNDIDSLKTIVEINLKKRQQEIPKVEKIIEDEMVLLFNWYNTLNIVPTIKSLHNYFETFRLDELSKIKNKVSEKDFEKISNMTRRLIGRILHNPTITLREFAENNTQTNKALEISNTLKELFKLKD